MLIEEFMEPLSVAQGKLAEAMGVSRWTINEICNNKRSCYGGHSVDALQSFWQYTGFPAEPAAQE
jgi:hypothetical protein